MKPCAHTGPCRRAVRTYGNHTIRYCKPQKALESRLRKEARKLPPADGLEDEFGPVPPRVPDLEWFDEVAVDNLIFGGPTRPLTPREKESFIHRTKSWTVEDVAHRLDSTEERVWQLRNYYLVVKPARAAEKSAA